MSEPAGSVKVTTEILGCRPKNEGYCPPTQSALAKYDSEFERINTIIQRLLGEATKKKPCPFCNDTGTEELPDPASGRKGEWTRPCREGCKSTEATNQDGGGD